jgi:hypothetical protein
MNMKNNLYWAIVCENYQGGDETYYFTSHEVAMKNFLKIVNSHKDEDEFRSDEDSCSWFDCGFNEYSTYIYVTERLLPEVYDDVIF